MYFETQHFNFIYDSTQLETTESTFRELKNCKLMQYLTIADCQRIKDLLSEIRVIYCLVRR